MGAICCLEKAWLPLQQGSSQNDGRRGQTFSKVLKREEVGQIKILEMQEESFYWWRFKCALELNTSLYKNLHSTELQKLKRRLLSQKLGCSETTRADLRNRRGVCFLKSWAAQIPRRPIWVNHVHLVFAFLSLSIYILINTNDRSNLAKITNLILSVVPKSSLLVCINNP
ncbi:hypothetical protein ACFX19_030023 [Malus domestica]